MNWFHSGSWVWAQLMSLDASVKNPSSETLLNTESVRAGGVLARASPPPRPTVAASTDVADRNVLRCMGFSEADESQVDSQLDEREPPYSTAYLRSLPSIRRISRYSQTSVTVSANAPYH